LGSPVAFMLTSIGRGRDDAAGSEVPDDSKVKLGGDPPGNMRWLARVAFKHIPHTDRGQKWIGVRKLCIR